MLHLSDLHFYRIFWFCKIVRPVSKDMQYMKLAKYWKVPSTIASLLQGLEIYHCTTSEVLIIIALPNLNVCIGMVAIKRVITQL